jgi:hypothetical protein
MIRTDLERPSSLKVMLIGTPIHFLGSGIPAMRLTETLISSRPGMRLARMSFAWTRSRMSFRAGSAAVLMLRLGRVCKSTYQQ